MSNVIIMLLELKWAPHSFNCWEDPLGEFWVLDDFSVSSHNFSKHVASFFIKRDLDRARHHFNGQGIERGIDWDATLRTVKAHKSAEHYPFKCALETIISGATWPLTRIAMFSPINTLCNRCGTAPEDSLHTFWTCPANCNLESEHVADTQKFIHTAITESIIEPCLWLRGILPSHYTHIPHTARPTHELKVISTLPAAVMFTSGTFYGDASGGPWTKYPTLRRVGCGLC